MLAAYFPLGKLSDDVGVGRPQARVLDLPSKGRGRIFRPTSVSRMPWRALMAATMKRGTSFVVILSSVRRNTQPARWCRAR
jgi:hypothetical protein